MNIRSLQEFLSPLREIAVIGRSAAIHVNCNEVLCHVMGFSLFGNGLRLYILQYDDTFRERAEAAEIEALCSAEGAHHTNRDYLRRDHSAEPVNPFQSISGLKIGDLEFSVTSSEHRLCSSADWECAALFTVFLRGGWNPIDIDGPDADALFLTTLELEGKYDAVPAFEPGAELRFHSGPSPIHILVEQPVTLTVGSPAPDRFLFRDERTGLEHWAQLNRVTLYDMWAEMESAFEDPRVKELMKPEELEHSRAEFEKNFSEVCPRGMCFPVIEYECEEGVTLQFASKAWLDTEPVARSGAIGFIVKPDKPTGLLGLPLKAAVIQDPVSPGTTLIEAELTMFSVSTSGEDIVIPGTNVGAP